METLPPDDFAKIIIILAIVALAFLSFADMIEGKDKKHR